jgi:hypothetical protein
VISFNEVEKAPGFLQLITWMVVRLVRVGKTAESANNAASSVFVFATWNVTCLNQLKRMSSEGLPAQESLEFLGLPYKISQLVGASQSISFTFDFFVDVFEPYSRGTTRNPAGVHP